MPRGFADLGRFSEPALLILISLAGGPKHGYAMTDDIEQMTGERLGPGPLYDALYEMLGFEKVTVPLKSTMSSVIHSPSSMAKPSPICSPFASSTSIPKLASKDHEPGTDPRTLIGLEMKSPARGASTTSFTPLREVWSAVTGASLGCGAGVRV